MSTIYRPKGKALEYSPLAVNLFSGCRHGCEYCYARFVSKKSIEQWRTEIIPTKNTLRSIAKDAAKFDGTENVLLCFLTDPYQPEEIEQGITREAIKILNGAGLPVTILTKGGNRALRDFDLLKSNPANEFAITLTGLDDEASYQWEPGAAPPAERIATLQTASFEGIKTWVSFEPVINPDGVISTIKHICKFTDLFKVGKLNYHEHAKSIDWRKFKHDVVEELEEVQARFILKQDLLKLERLTAGCP